jgi:hypothetical protein
MGGQRSILYSVALTLAFCGPCFADPFSASAHLVTERTFSSHNAVARSKIKGENSGDVAGPMRLDLRAPELSKLADSEIGSANRHSSGADNNVSAKFNPLSAVKPVGGAAEEFARRVHREGLPVARLFESKSALVSLGLNQKGKPGLWLIQKTR